MDSAMDTSSHLVIIGSIVFLITGASVYFYPGLSVLLMVFLSMMFGFMFSLTIDSVNNALAAVLINGAAAALGGAGVKFLIQKIKMKKPTDERTG